jgi:hypothetical protein
VKLGHPGKGHGNSPYGKGTVGLRTLYYAAFGARQSAFDEP